MKIQIPKEKIYFAIYIHESHRYRLEEVKKYWLKYIDFNLENFKYTYFKKNKINTKRRNVGNIYFGLLRLMVIDSSTLNRKIQGWTEGIYGNL